MSAAGAVDADAPPTSENDTPAIPNTGSTFPPRFRFEACFFCAIIESSLLRAMFAEITRSIFRAHCLGRHTGTAWLILPEKRHKVPEGTAAFAAATIGRAGPYRETAPAWCRASATD